MLRCPSCGLTPEQLADRGHRYLNPVRECVATKTAIECNLGKPVPSTLLRVVRPAWQVERLDNARKALK